MSTDYLPADLVVDQARLRVRACLDHARAVADMLRAGRIDWLAAFNLITDRETELNTVCWALEALLDGAGLSAWVERVAELRVSGLAALQALQRVLREQHLFDGPTARRGT